MEHETTVEQAIDNATGLAEDAIERIGKALADFDEMDASDAWDDEMAKRIREEMATARACARCISEDELPVALKALQKLAPPAAKPKRLARRA